MGINLSSTLKKSYEFFSPRVWAGLQIGERVIKAAVIEKNNDGIETVKEAIEKIPEGLVQNGRVLQPERLGLAIQTLIQKHNLSMEEVALFVEELPFYVRHVKFPDMPRRELKQAMTHKVQVDFPVDPNELVIRYYKNPRPCEKELHEYVAIAINRTNMDPVIKAIHAAGLSVSHFTIEPSALFNGLKQKGSLQHQERTILIVRTDTQRMMLAIFSEEEMIYARYAPIHPDKHEWEQEIERTIISWNGAHASLPIEEVILLGEKEDWSEVEQEVASFMPIQIRQFHAPFTACLGLIGNRRNKLNFYSDRPKRTRRFRELAILPALIGLILLAGSGYSYFSASSLKRDIEHFKGLLSEHREVATLLEDYKGLTEKKRLWVAEKEKLQKNHTDPLYILEVVDFSEKQVEITHITFMQGEWQVRGRAKDHQSVIQYLGKLQSDTRLQEVQLLHSSGYDGATEFLLSIKESRGSEHAKVK